ncbi:hypothetical protein [Qipengyuania atrilutea]|nr:hypothetical protein [Actirhodobacter atriluteus]
MAALDAYDLSDMAVVNRLAIDLTAEEAGALKTYAIHHLATSAAFCGDVLVDKSGRTPETIGEAIDFTLEREARLAAERKGRDLSQFSPVARYRIALDKLIDARDTAINDREELLIAQEMGLLNATHNTVELDKLITRLEAQIAELRANPPA